MRLLEATSETASRKPSADAASTRSTPSPQGSGSFAAVLSVTRESSRDVMNILLPQQPRQVREARQERIQAAESETKSRRDETQAAAESQVSAQQPSRVDRLRDSVREDTQAQADADESTSSKARRADDSKTVREDVPVPANQTSTPAPATAGVTAAGAWTMNENGSTQALSPAGSMVQSAVPSAATSIAPAPAPVTGADVETSAPVKIANTSSPGAAPATPPASNGGSDQAGSRESAAAAGTAKLTTASARPASGTSDFQQLLSQLGRQRMPEAVRPETATGPATLKAKTATPVQAKVDVESTESVSELARLVRSQVGSRRSLMTIELTPQELGRVRAEVRVQDGVTSVQFEAQTPAGEEALRSRLHDLRNALEQQGIRVDDMQVNYVPPSPTAHQGQDAQTPADAQQWQWPADQGQTGGWGGDSRQSSGHSAGEYTGNEERTASWTLQQVSMDLQTAGVDVVV